MVWHSLHYKEILLSEPGRKRRECILTRTLPLAGVITFGSIFVRYWWPIIEQFKKAPFAYTSVSILGQICEHFSYLNVTALFWYLIQKYVYLLWYADNKYEVAKLGDEKWGLHNFPKQLKSKNVWKICIYNNKIWANSEIVILDLPKSGVVTNNLSSFLTGNLR